MNTNESDTLNYIDIIIIPNDNEELVKPLLVSTADELHFNGVSSDQYQLIYQLNEFIKTDLATLVKIISEYFHTNNPDTKVIFYLDMDLVESLVSADFISKILKKIYINTVRYPNIQLYIGNDEDEDDDEEEDEEDDALSSFLETYGVSLSNDKSQSNTKVKRRKYPKSKAIDDGKHPKKDIERHNIIITNKENYKRDKRIIKEFLKDFIPGDSKWKREYRSEVLERWIKSFIILRKEAEKRQRAWKNRDRRKFINNKLKTLNGISKGMARYNSFYDPNK